MKNNLINAITNLLIALRISEFLEQKDVRDITDLLRERIKK